MFFAQPLHHKRTVAAGTRAGAPRRSVAVFPEAQFIERKERHAGIQGRVLLMRTGVAPEAPAY